MKLMINVEKTNYDIYIQKGLLEQLSDYLDVNKRYCIITDDGVPAVYLRTVKQQLPNALTMVVPQGEGSKSLDRLSTVCKQLLMHHFSRNDVLIALGGGVVGDLVGFVASIYMRGIEYISIPTTTLAQIDSSIGGKTAVNFMERKNILGTFYHPSMVLIDPLTLDTLTERQYNSGLMEALKAGLLEDHNLYELFINNKEKEKIEEVIERALIVKKNIVEADEKEQSIRKLLNFGHTVGHALESIYGMQQLYHGEAVLNGMLPMIQNKEIYQQLLEVARRMNIEIKEDFKWQDLMEYILDDKKHIDDKINIIVLKEVEKPIIELLTYEKLGEDLEKYYAR